MPCLLFIFLSLLHVANGALPICPAGTTCPPGGLWSEWAVTGNKNCPTKCGACSKLFYTRRCLSAQAKCNCVGPTAKYVPCNIQTCQYPSQRTCCIPYVSMLINGTFQCGPIPKESTVGTGPCCKAGGIWSEWTMFAYDDSTKQWKKSRQCLSSAAGCACSGEETFTQAQCPCPRKLQNANVCENIDPSLQPIYRMYHFWDLIINDAQGTAHLNVACHNDNPPIYYCWEGVTGFPRSAALILLVPPAEKNSTRCRVDRTFDCRGRDYSIKTMPVTFTCDVESGYWRHDSLGVLVEGYNQPIFKQAYAQ